MTARGTAAGPGMGPPLAAASLLFLGLPVAIFLAGWLRGPWSWLSVGALVWSAWASLRAPGDHGTGSASRAPGADVASPSPAVWTLDAPNTGDDTLSGSAAPRRLAAAAILLLVVGLAGSGGVGVQSWDWDKHNAVLADLISQPWPVAYRLEPAGERLALVYYVAYYLPAAAAGKLLGWSAANRLLFLWTAAGVILAWLWVARLGRASAPAALFVVVLFTGFDLLGVFVQPPGARALPAPWWTTLDLEWWHGRFVYPGNVTLLLYAPHQALGGWLATALVLDTLRRSSRGVPLAAPLALCLLWSPFAAIGLAALTLALALARQADRPLSVLAREQLSAPSLVMVVSVALPLALYLSARLAAPQLTSDLEPPAAAREAAGFAFLPAALGVDRFAAAWAWFLTVELLPLVAALGAVMWLARRGSTQTPPFSRPLLAAASAVLATVPLVAYGFFNDWAMRASIPALFALQVVAARALSNGAAPAWARRGVAALLLVAGLYPLSQLRLQAAAILERRDWVYVVPRHRVADLFELQRTSVAYYGFLQQYVADVRAPFFRYLAPLPEARSIGSPDAAHGGAAGPSAADTRSN